VSDYTKKMKTTLKGSNRDTKKDIK
jgi:hypothetical protein